MNKYSVPIVSDAVAFTRTKTPTEMQAYLCHTIKDKQIRLNKAAYDVVELCNGEKNVEQISMALAQRYATPKNIIQQTVMKLLNTLIYDQGVIELLRSGERKHRQFYPAVELVRRLKSGTWETTTACNLRCLHCYMNGGTRQPNELSTVEAKDLIDQLAHLGAISLTVTGGEPLLRPDIYELMAYASTKPIAVNLRTNGYLVNKECVARLKAAGVRNVGLSLDGATADTHDRFRGRNGSFQRVLNAIDIFLQEGINVFVVTTVHRFNLHEMADIFDLCDQRGIAMSVDAADPNGRAVANSQSCAITIEEYEQALRDLYDHSREVSGREFDNFHCSVDFDKDSEHRCGAGTDGFAITAVGDVIPCLNLRCKEMTVGNVKTHSLQELWNQPWGPFARLRKITKADIKGCQDCSYFNVCQGGCLATGYWRTGRLDAADPKLCADFRARGTYVRILKKPKYLIKTVKFSQQSAIR
jgi:radical SAM protein with 4Fe4S-binding SPASM domain